MEIITLQNETNKAQEDLTHQNYNIINKHNVDCLGLLLS